MNYHQLELYLETFRCELVVEMSLTCAVWVVAHHDTWWTAFCVQTLRFKPEQDRTIASIA
jgi:hypothetical protein